MSPDKIEEISLKVKALLAVPHCDPDLKAAGKTWLDSVGTENQKSASVALVKELKEDVMPIDAVIAFFQTSDAASKFGEEACKKILEGSIESKKNGAKYCTCDACKAGAALLDLEDDLIK